MKKNIQKYNYFGNKDCIEQNVDQCITIAHSMLNLRPPLLIIQPQQRDESMQDTNRISWEENSDKPLIYYRPVLVYGNGLQIAALGLVGNMQWYYLEGHVDELVYTAFKPL